MLKTRKKSLSLLVTLAFLFTMILPGVAFGASSEKGVMTITNAVNENVTDDGETKVELGWIKVAIDADDLIVGDTTYGTLYATVELPDDVEFTDEDSTTSKSVYTVINSSDDFSWVLDFAEGGVLDTVYVDESADDDIYVDVTFTYVDEDNFKVDKFEGSILVGTKADAEVTVTADDPTTVSMGENKEIAEITLEENIAGALEVNSKILFTLPDGYEWDADGNWYTSHDTAEEAIAGDYGLKAYFSNLNGDELTLTICKASSPLADEISFTATVTVFPDADEGDVVVEVEDASSGDLDSNVEDTELVVAENGDSEVTVTADEDTGSEDQIWMATEGTTVDNELWEITFETSGSFTVGDDVLLELPDGVEFIESEYTADKDLGDFKVKGLYNGNQNLWLTVDSSGDEITLSGLYVGVTPDAEAGDLVVEISGDVVDTSVVAGVIKNRVEVSADSATVKVGLEQAAGDITLVETDEDSMVEVFYLLLPTGVAFSGAPTVEVNGDEVEDAATVKGEDDDLCEIDLKDELDDNDVDTIVISGIEYDIDSRYNAGSEIEISIGGKDTSDDSSVDELNALKGTDGAQFEDEANDAVFSVVNAVVGSPDAVEASMTIGSSTMIVNGEEVAMDVAPYIKGDRTFLPVRFVANALGISDNNILWDGANRTVTLMKGDKVVQIKIGSQTMLINGAAVTMDVAPEITNDRTMLPVRFIAQAFGATVSWDAATQEVTIELD